LLDEPPIAAKVGVLRSDFQEPCYAVAKFTEYLQTTKDGKPNLMWRKMPANQLAKCAEALALRKAFPQELSGLYTADEMGQAEPGRDDDERTPHAGQRKSQPPAPSSVAPAVTQTSNGDKSSIGKIKAVEDRTTSTGKTFYAVMLYTGFACTTWSETLAKEARAHKADDHLVELVTEVTKYAPKLTAIRVVNTVTGELA
jgi:hypothetical protein